MREHSGKFALIKRSLREGIFFLRNGGAFVRGDLLADLPDPFDEDLHFAAFLLFLHFRKVFELVGIGMGEIERKLRAGRACNFIEDARSHNDGLQCAACFTAERSRGKSSKGNGDTREREERHAEVVAHELRLAHKTAAEERACIFARHTDGKVEHAHPDQRQRTCHLTAREQRAEVEVETKEDIDAAIEELTATEEGAETLAEEVAAEADPTGEEARVVEAEEMDACGKDACGKDACKDAALDKETAAHILKSVRESVAGITDEAQRKAVSDAIIGAVKSKKSDIANVIEAQKSFVNQHKNTNNDEIQAAYDAMNPHKRNKEV